MRFYLAAVLLASPATAWEATIGPICTLTHTAEDAVVELTYDPAQPLYSITITREGDTWTEAPVFGMQFFGRQPNMIRTDRHGLSDADRSLTVTDRGFGNVLDGLQFNETATAFTSSGQTVTLSLDGAAPEVQKFRECAAAGLV